jgi:hypothetical protein
LYRNSKISKITAEIIHANETKQHAVCSNHNPALQNLQKYFALQSLHCLQRPRLFSGGSGRYSSGSPVKHIVDSQIVENLLENEGGPINDQDLIKTDYDPDRSLVLIEGLSHFLTNLLRNLASCQTSFN